MMESLSLTDVKTDLPGCPGSLDDRLYSAMHNEVKNICAMHKKQLGPNTRDWRKGCLIFWKLRPPNLILNLYAIRTTSEKLFVYSLLAKTSVRSALGPEMCIRIEPPEQGNATGNWA
jgi:hypothetical protein